MDHWSDILALLKKSVAYVKYWVRFVGVREGLTVVY